MGHLAFGEMGAGLLPLSAYWAILVWGSYYWQILKLVVLLLIPPHILCR